MSNPKNFGELARTLTAYIPLLDAGEARRRINVAYVNEAMGHSWSFLLKRWTLQTEASYAIGTLNVTTGSQSVTLSVDGTWDQMWTNTPSSRKIAIQGRFEPYVITITGTNAGTLADPWIGATQAEASYMMWRDTYPLPIDCGYAKMMALYDPLQRYRIPLKNQATFARWSSQNPQLVTNTCDAIMMADMSTEAPPRPLFTMWPAIGSVRAYHGWYFRCPSFMTADAEFPFWPREYQDMIPVSAAIEHYKTPRFHSPKYLRELMSTYADWYEKAVKDFDGNPAIDSAVEDVFTGRGSRRGTNANWTPNELGFSGTHMTNS